MQARFFFTRLVACASLVLGLTAAQAQNSQNYTLVTPEQPSDTTGKIEVLDFFAYSCVHCNAMEPLTARWAATLPDNVVLKHVPVAFNAGMGDLQRLYYALEALDRLDLHPAVFRAIHTEKQRIFDARAITNWAVDQGLDRQAFEAAFKSFGVQSQAARANNLWRAYGIDGTPSFGVGGRFITSPSQNSSYQATLVQVQTLLTRIMNEQATEPAQAVEPPSTPATDTAPATEAVPETDATSEPESAPEAAVAPETEVTPAADAAPDADATPAVSSVPAVDGAPEEPTPAPEAGAAPAQD